MHIERIQDRFPAFAAFLAALIWSTNGIFLHLIDLPFTTLAFFRSAVPTVFILVWYSIRGYRPARESLGIKLTASALNAVRLVFYFYGFLQTTVANAVVALYTWPIFALVFGRFILGERARPRQVVLLLVAFLGVPILYIGATSPLAEGGGRGISALLVSAALHALIMILLKRAKPGVDRFESVLSQNFVSAFVYIPFLWIPAPNLSPGAVGFAVFYSAFIGILGFGLFFAALHRISSTRASNIVYFEVVGAVILAWIVFGEIPSWNTIVGGSLIVVSVLLSSRWRST